MSYTSGLPCSRKIVLCAFVLLSVNSKKAPVVEDVAVLVDFQERGASVAVRPAHHRLHVLGIAVHRTGDERCICAECKRHGIERMVDRPVGRTLRDFALLRGGAVLPLRQAVYLVIEQQDLHVYVAAQEVDQVIPSYGEGVAVSRDDPYVQVGAACLESRGNGRGASVDGIAGRTCSCSTESGSNSRSR